MSAELLDVLDETGERTGTAPRDEVHEKGLLHRVVHCWIVSEREDGLWVWFQQRSPEKAVFPGLYDAAVGGHVDAGETPLETVLREMREEIGLAPPPERLSYFGAVREDFPLPAFDDRELVELFLYRDPAPAFRPGEEVSRMIRLRAEDLSRKDRETVFGRDESGAPVRIEPGEWCRHEGALPLVLEQIRR